MPNLSYSKLWNIRFKIIRFIYIIICATGKNWTIIDVEFNFKLIKLYQYAISLSLDFGLLLLGWFLYY